jgi:hypothetical protein
MAGCAVLKWAFGIIFLAVMLLLSPVFVVALAFQHAQYGCKMLI